MKELTDPMDLSAQWTMTESSNPGASWEDDGEMGADTARMAEWDGT